LGGALLGALALDLLPVLLRDVLPLDVQPVPSLLPVLQGTLVGLGLALLFAARPLLSVRQTPPLRTLRAAYDENSSEGGRLFRIGANILLVVGTLLFALHLTNRFDYALGFTGGTAVAFALLAAVARLLTWGARRFFPLSWSYEWRQGLANLFRPHNQTLMLLLGLGLGTFLMSTLYLAQHALVAQVESVGGGDRPNAVLFDIQSDQVEGMQEIFAGLKLPMIQQVPIVTMRLHSVKGKSVAELRQEPGRRRNNWALTREYRCTYRDTLNAQLPRALSQRNFRRSTPIPRTGHPLYREPTASPATAPKHRPLSQRIDHRSRPHSLYRRYNPGESVLCRAFPRPLQHRHGTLSTRRYYRRESLPTRKRKRALAHLGREP
jgi:putative ABC transport system permease protein